MFRLFAVILLSGIPVHSTPLAAAPATTTDRTGEVLAVAGRVNAQAADLPARRLQRGDAVYTPERIVTGKRASIEIRFSDGGRLQLGPESEFELTRYDWREDAAAFTVRITKGVFRLVTGLIARRDPERYLAGMLTVSIGVRGTDFAGETDGQSARVVLLESEDGAPAAIEVWNDYGRVRIDQAGYGTEIPDTHSPPSPPRHMRLEGVSNLARTLGQVQRLQMPRPPQR